MDTVDPQPKSKPNQAKPLADPREARLAKALRDNLRRRKQAKAAAPGEPGAPLTPLADD